MEDPIRRDVVRRIVQEYHPDADPAEIDYQTRRAIGAAEVALYDAIRAGAPGAGLPEQESVRDAARW